ncbi:M1 family metallopeptidase [Rhodohalobacter mucosus]|uniref:Aminopeptidase N n=1 Tax=Rhodohalobacter mucosus TaxID=2079485 RepID=A0A316TWB1_9BACT|nr:M1 family aminopeptidase [Rhodohalobacter mucosus]PWN07669.1 peptidase M1 [Rhodohalobacter mucosus]
MHRYSFAFLLLLLLPFVLSTGLISCGKSLSVPPNEPGVSLELAEFRKSLLSDIQYTLYFNIPERREMPIPATVSIKFTLNNEGYDIPLDFRESADKLRSLTVNGTSAEIIYENEHILLPAGMLHPGENQVDIELIAGESSLNRNPDYLFTLFVPDRARTAFPLFDQPDLKAVYKLTLEIPSEWEAVSNAALSDVIQEDSTKILEFRPSDRFSSYLFSFVAGRFEKVTRTVNGVEMTMLHRESDPEKVERNLDDIFELHAASLEWLEEYTAIEHPFQKFDFALIPAFPYGGMEHVGAIQYRAGSLFLDEDPSDSRLLSRASLIAHETAHMWFGNLVTMKWFNDVWTKEVYANFLAAKIMNPEFPDINHELNFLLRHHPSAYSVDRTEGANPIRQNLANLNEAGQMYGPIIYNKAPIMMRQLELLLGDDLFREGIREYLSSYAFENATWPDLIRILDQKTSTDLAAWSDVWVNTPGRPHFSIVRNGSASLLQTDPAGQRSRFWPQQFSIVELSPSGTQTRLVTSQGAATELDQALGNNRIYNANGYGYGLFPASPDNLEAWLEFGDTAKGSELINLYENMLEGVVDPADYYGRLLNIIRSESNQLLLNRALSYLGTIYWNLMSKEERESAAPGLEEMLWNLMMQQPDASRKRIFFDSYRNVAVTENGVQRLYDVWAGNTKIEGLSLSDNDLTGIAAILAVKSHPRAEDILRIQLDNIQDSDRKRRFEFLQPALSADPSVRDQFFESLKNPENREIESWVISSLNYLHHPLRTDHSEKYILPSLELLEEIQVTGDIFFPSRWLDATLSNHSSDNAVETVRTFLNERPGYNEQLRMKILQSADMLFRSNTILAP